ncbi:MAG: CinA family protein [Caldisericia bacterium]|nr:CinA family protein [Caldisericia bacterium]
MKNKYLLNYLIEIRNKLIKEKKTLGISESCTGGYLSYLFNFLPNSSKFFKGSIVVYTNEIKEKVLKVDSEILKNFGAVSIETSFDMAKKAKYLFDVDYSIGVTGNLGPITQEGKNKGLIYVSILFCDKFIKKSFILYGTREEIRQKIVYNIIYLFYINLIRGAN